MTRNVWKHISATVSVIPQKQPSMQSLEFVHYPFPSDRHSLKYRVQNILKSVYTRMLASSRENYERSPSDVFNHSAEISVSKSGGLWSSHSFWGFSCSIVLTSQSLKVFKYPSIFRLTIAAGLYERWKKANTFPSITLRNVEFILLKVTLFKAHRHM